MWGFMLEGPVPWRSVHIAVSFADGAGMQRDRSALRVTEKHKDSVSSAIKLMAEIMNFRRNGQQRNSVYYGQTSISPHAHFDLC